MTNPIITMLNIPWMIEAIEEKFDDALSLLTPECFIYGGAIRDIAAGIPIGGDLDVGVPFYLFDKINQKFTNSTRWIKKSLNKKQAYTTKTNGYSVSNRTCSYTNVFEKEVQLIQSNKDNIDKYGKFNLAWLVDITCCGLSTSIFGEVAEIVPGAFIDCKNHVLNLNKSIPPDYTINLKKLDERISKLVSRGWIDNITNKEK